MLRWGCPGVPPRPLRLSFGRISVKGGLSNGGGSTLVKGDNWQNTSKNVKYYFSRRHSS